ncbi:hypothetical protein SAMN05660359_02741 [Geodermatophilus obscurus]|uniref:Uncharacterized protein n=1 Tax=Geodermatophilus obscurus TaxID=1861 RepID=A0A1I5GBS9_9ACTN|nr:hypothetical protein [Geodermatophilus obscurus]SFO33426.1 hypothetical protein SAMN05660359_02741 [Geodermatophilus obscurus]
MAKVLLGTVAGTVAVAAAAVAGLLVTMPAGVHGFGAMVAEVQGHTDTRDAATAAQAPDGAVPYWTRPVGADVTVVRPGDAYGEDDGSVRVDMDLSPGTGLPSTCTPLPRAGMPWDGGGSWPDLTGEPALLCEGWVTVVVDGHLYTWTGPAAQS